MERKDFKFKLDEMDEELGTFNGYASIFGEVDSYNEIVLKGAFRKTLKDNDGKFPLTWFHNVKEPLGIIHARESKFGLKVEGELNLDVQSAREKRSLMKQDVITGLSIGFKTLRDEWDDEIRKLKEIQLYEIALITRNFQACPGAEVGEVKEEGLPEEFKPYENEHSARLKPPGMEKIRVRRTHGSGKGMVQGVKVPTTIDVIWYIIEKDGDEVPVAQALRFPIKKWTVSEAKGWLKENEIKYTLFEPASKSLEGVLSRIVTIETAENLSEESVELIKESINRLETLVEEREPLPIGTLEPIFEPLHKEFMDSLNGLKNSIGGK